MKTRSPFANSLCAAVLAVVTASTALAGTLYVWQGSPNPTPPYTNWATAATNIQDAVDAAAASDEIVVTNGVYQTGARAVYGMSNRVVVTKPVTVRSVNGPDVTRIKGYRVPGTTNGPEAVRCVYLTNGAVLAGFTLTKGTTQTSGDFRRNQAGGGVWCEGPSAVVSNCVLTGNSARSYGGAAYSGTLNNCTLTGNSASSGGGASWGTLNNCALTGNSASFGGGAYAGTLYNCTLTDNTADYDGGGAYSGTLSNCSLTGNSAYYGGGAYSGALNNCTLTGNSARSCGGGAILGMLNNCTLTGNSAGEKGGGAFRGTLNNCIVYHNSAPYGDTNYSGGTLTYCCTTPLPAGAGNLADDPQLASVWRLSASSPCLGQGNTAYASGVDVDGEPWANPPAIGCDEYWSGSVTGTLSVAVVAVYTNVSVGFGVDFQAIIGGRVSASRWVFGDGVILSNRPWTSHAWTAAGDYVVELRAYNESCPAGVAATVTVHVVEEDHYVALSSCNMVPPYSSWGTAATNIQDAVDAAAPGARVWVSNGVYQTGVRAVYGMSNRVAVTKPVTVRSVNGAASTIIQGYWEPGTTNGPAAVRCVYLTNGAMLAGFTLTNGATQTSGDSNTNRSGGGVWCEGPGSAVSDCMLTGNSAFESGGGAYNGTLNNCALTGNSAGYGGGAYWGTLDNCVLTGNCAAHGGGAWAAAYVGGAWSGTLNNCILTGNSASGGGGAYGGTLSNCMLLGNSAGGGGGADDCTLNHCTLADNSAYDGGGFIRGNLGSILNDCILTGNTARNAGGGAYGGTLNNCLLTGNSAGTNGGGAYAGTLNNCTLTSNLASAGGGAYEARLNNCTLMVNSAYDGGGACRGTLKNCTLTGNSASRYGGGAYFGTLHNCIVYYSSAIDTGANYYHCGLNYCCTTPLPTNGTGNLASTPSFVDTNGWSNLRLQSNSPCVNAGNNGYVTNSTDLDGCPRIVGGIVDIGAYEYQGPDTGEFIGWLQRYGLPTDGSADATDPDGDTRNNWQEWRCGTDPTNAASVLRLLAPVSVGDRVSVSWSSVPGLTYFLERSADLSASPLFQPLATNLPGQAGVTTYLDTNAPGLPPRFYRVGVGD